LKKCQGVRMEYWMINLPLALAARHQISQVSTPRTVEFAFSSVLRLQNKKLIVGLCLRSITQFSALIY